MGKLTMNAGLFAFKANQAGTQADNFIALNFRYPKGVTAEGLEIGVERTIGMEGQPLPAMTATWNLTTYQQMIHW